jgi:uncharacterized protein (DUF433 family)
MVEPRPDMLPDSEGTTPVMEKETPREVEPEPKEIHPAEPQTPPKGYVPHQALEEERKKRKDAEVALAETEARLRNLEGSRSFDGEELSDEAKYLKGEIDRLNGVITNIQSGQSFQKLVAQYPKLAEYASEFEDFKSDYPGVSLEKIASLFLNEKGLLVDKPRIGLEKPTGGSRTAPTSGLSEEDVKRLRESNPRRYIQMLRDGKINPDDIR